MQEKEREFRRNMEDLEQNKEVLLILLGLEAHLDTSIDILEL